MTRSTDQSWQAIDALFARALDRPPEERDAFVDAASGGDPTLRDAVRALLRASEASRDFLERPVLRVPTDVPGLPRPEEEQIVGRRVGAYRVARVVARGGMGTVCLADRVDGEFQQRVALKLLRRGLDTDDVLARFRTERQILASLQHRHIARLLGGGATEDHRPFLVMEYVDGEPIDVYCDARRLTVLERLRLFLDAARAVEHAHRHLVVHRDLKPSNILVTRDGDVKLVDFGIAKLLDGADLPSGAARTRTGVQLMTPQYASPEQLAGRPIGPASDVYQLGLLLYELLAGSRPFEVAGLTPGEIERLLCERDPAPPGEALLRAPDADAVARARGTEPRALSRMLRGDLETIVCTAIQAEPERRYGSAEQLAADVERFLTHRPVAARPDTIRYRTRKFVRRHRAATAFAALVAFMAIIYMVTITGYAERLQQERDLARREAAKAAEVQSLLAGLFRQGDPFAEGIAARAGSVTVREALDIGARRVREELRGRPAVQAPLLRTISEVYQGLGLPTDARTLQEEALRLDSLMHGARSPEVVRGRWRIGVLLGEEGREEAADSALREARRLARLVHGPGSPQEGLVLSNLGLLLIDRGALDSAAALLQDAVTTLRGSGRSFEQVLAGALTNLSQAYLTLGRTGEAEAAIRDALAARERAYGPDHPWTAVTLTKLAGLLSSRGEWDEAIAVNRRALATFDAALGPRHVYSLSTLNNLAVNLDGRGDHAEAIRIHRDLLRRRIALHGERHPEVAASLQNLAAALNRTGQRDEALALARRAHDEFLATLGPRHFKTALPLLTVAEIHLGRSEWAEAARASRRAAELLGGALPADHWITAVARGRLGQARLGQERYDEAAALLRESHRRLSGQQGPASRHHAEVLDALVRLSEAQHDAADAAAFREELAALLQR